MNNSYRRLSHQIQTLIRCLVKKQHHIPPFVHPQQKHAYTMKQLKQHFELLA